MRYLGMGSHFKGWEHIIQCGAQMTSNSMPKVKYFWYILTVKASSKTFLIGASAYQRIAMAWIITKYLITAGMVVLISEIAKRSDKLGGFIAALPLVTVLTLVWLYVENQSTEKIANHAYYTFWYVIPTLPMFLLFPYLLPKMGFWLTLGACIAATILSFGVFAIVVKQFGIDLL